ncbi:MAG: HDIG domain-containing metalloprotein [Planctomycetota bacterium]|mgnify:CR=1 FL=1
MFHPSQEKRRSKLEVFKTPAKKLKSVSLETLDQKRQKGILFLFFTLIFTYLLSFDSPTFTLIPTSLKSFFLFFGNFCFCFLLNSILCYVILVHYPRLVQKILHQTVIYLALFLIILTSKITVLFHLTPFVIPFGFIAYLMALIFGQQVTLILTPFLWIYSGHIFYFSVLSYPVTLDMTSYWQWSIVSLRHCLVVFLGSLLMIAACNQVNRRNKLTLTGVSLAIAHTLLLALFFLFSGFVQRNSLGFYPIFEEFCFAAGSGLLTGFFLSTLLPFFESIFDFTTDISLLELSSGNNPLLERMLLEAPGTFHHSMMVGILAEAAADAIGGRSLLAKVGAYYHDIGKLVRPDYFTENENNRGSRHETLSPLLSTLIILSHVKDGVQLAKLFNLPSAVVDIIQEHHGCGLVQFFYVEALNNPDYREDFPDKREKENKEFFRYPGPRAKTKEAAIVLIADCVEAASRSLSDPSYTKLETLIEKIVHSKLMDQQLEECNLTFKEIHLIKQSLLTMLTSLFHTRIQYPEAPKKNQGPVSL